MKKIIYVAIIITLFFCACNTADSGSNLNENSKDEYSSVDFNNISENENVKQETSTTVPKHKYVDGYQQDKIYNKIMEIENCKDPDVLCRLLKDIYEEDFSYIKMTHTIINNPESIGHDGYEAPYDDFICSSLAVYNASSPLYKAPISSDTYLFFKPNSDQPAFMMDCDATYIVYSYDIKNFENGTHIHTINSWIISDLYMCLHGYIDETAENKAYFYDAVSSMAFYLELENAINDLLSNVNVTPVVPIRFDILDASFNGYKNQTGATFFEKTTQDSIVFHYLKLNDSVNYYYGTNDVLIGVENGEMCLIAGYASDITGQNTTSLRSVINAMNAPQLFEVLPEMTTVKNLYNTQNLFYWKIENGYIGFITIGGNIPSDCYDYAAHSYILFEDLSCINHIEHESMAIDFAPDEYYLNPDQFETYHFENLTYGQDIVLTPYTKVTDFRFFLLDTEELINGNCVITEMLYSKELISRDKPFVTRIYIGGVAGPYYGISFLDETGKSHSFVIYESGEDGHYFLSPLKNHNT